MKKLILGVLTCVFFAANVNAQVQAPDFPAEDPNFRALVWGLLGGNRVTLYPAKLSPNIPFSIPLPDGTNIIGTRDYSDGFLQVLLDVPLEARAAIAFYKQRLNTSVDWSNPRAATPSITSFGFTFSNTVTTPSGMDEFFLDGLCHKPSGYSMDVNPSGETRSNRTNISLYIFRSDCNRQEAPRFATSPAPLLIAPENGQALGRSSLQSDIIVVSNAILRTNLETEALLAHYEKQWDAKNWKKLSSHVTKSARWSLWTLEQGERVYLGMMYANAMPGQVGVQQVSMFVGNLF